MSASLCLLVFIELLLRPIVEKSTYLHERELIRICRPLNKVLYENRHGIEYIYNKIKGDDQLLSKVKVTKYFTQLLHKQYPFFDVLEMHKIFVYSLEIVADEHCNMDKYNNLKYVEFLEYVCRIAIKMYEDRHE